MKALRTVQFKPTWTFTLKPSTHWINDPNGPIYFGGKYHLYYQYLPNQKQWGYGIGWGHASSLDRKTWKHHGWALKPSHRYDRDGCFSGNTIVHRGQLIAFYTGVRRMRDSAMHCEVQCVATSLDGHRFRKRRKPVLIDPPPDTRAPRTGWRDPFVFAHRSTFYMLVGSGEEGVAGTILLYQGGKDPLLDPYVYKGILVERPGGKCMLECPFLVRLDARRWILGASPEGEPPVIWEGTFTTKGECIPSFALSPPTPLYPTDPRFYAATAEASRTGARRPPMIWGWLRGTRTLVGGRLISPSPGSKI